MKKQQKKLWYKPASITLEEYNILLMPAGQWLDIVIASMDMQPNMMY